MCKWAVKSQWDKPRNLNKAASWPREQKRNMERQRERGRGGYRERERDTE